MHGNTAHNNAQHLQRSQNLGSRVWNRRANCSHWPAWWGPLHGIVIAVDPDEEKSKLAEYSNWRDNMEYDVGNDKSFPEAKYDIIFMNCIIHWISNEVLYKRFFNNLYSGGYLASQLALILYQLVLKIYWREFHQDSCKMFTFRDST